MEVESRLKRDVLLVLHTEVNHVCHRQLAVIWNEDGSVRKKESEFSGRWEVLECEWMWCRRNQIKERADDGTIGTMARRTQDG